MSVRHVHAGFSMIEVLLTIVILVIGLLGLIGMQARAIVLETESYQRGGALGLLRSMEAVVHGARLPDYSTWPYSSSSPFADPAWSSTDGSVAFGTGDAYSDCADIVAMPEKAICDWSMALKGAAEVRAGARSGAMLGARGCLIRTSPVTVSGAIAEFHVVVVWQGLFKTADPAAGSPGAVCASTVNFGAGLRRSAVTHLLIPSLSG